MKCLIKSKLVAVVFFTIGLMWLMFGGNNKVLTAYQWMFLGLVFLPEFRKSLSQKMAGWFLTAFTLLIFFTHLKVY